MKPYGRMGARVGLVVAWYAAVGVGTVFAEMMVLPDAVVTIEGKAITGKGASADPVVRELLASFERAEAAVQKEDLQSLMKFYSAAYNYHGLKQADVWRVWEEVFTHYNKLSSTHLFSTVTILKTGSQIRAEVACTGGLYGTEEQSGKRITIDSWFQEVHYLVKEDGVWRFLGNAGEAPAVAPFSSAPHHPLF
ncbi:MAG: hypothetical protein OEY28_02520 [Nitrospira sp.]|nr:hypothetical protein [Nitrospira sp.]